MFHRTGIHFGSVSANQEKILQILRTGIHLQISLPYHNTPPNWIHFHLNVTVIHFESVSSPKLILPTSLPPSHYSLELFITGIHFEFRKCFK
jgi:hypothetical protein